MFQPAEPADVIDPPDEGNRDDCEYNHCQGEQDKLTGPSTIKPVLQRNERDHAVDKRADELHTLFARLLRAFNWCLRRRRW
ncbi:MAG TPA: hypothetical protein VMM76_11525, partial [Pirellulaceae bacterium]|nr:hypothetical protein [Pirellulaceae bacterium]